MSAREESTGKLWKGWGRDVLGKEKGVVRHDLSE